MTTSAIPLRSVTAALASAFALVLTGEPGLAERNRNGALIVHTNDAVSYSAGAAYCGGDFDDPASCEEAGTRSNLASDEAAVIWVLASFQRHANPAVTVVYFGIDHDPGDVEFVGWSHCGPPGSLEIPDDGWPVTGLGNSVAFGHPIAGDLLFPVYWFAAAGEAGAHLGTAVNPLGGYAAFVDDSNPPLLDPIDRFGVMGWQMDGLNDCEGIPYGACCYDAVCRIEDEPWCIATGGLYLGEGAPCDPNPCGGPAGACCLEDGHCEVLLPVYCDHFAGQFLGGGAVCDPSPCAQPPQACCFATGICTFVPENECTAGGGTPQGPRTRCDQIACRAPQLGACCMGDQTCRVSGDADCALLGGLFYPGAACEPFPCVTPVAPTTWGKLRAVFR
jgi:hypothetical protein